MLLKPHVSVCMCAVKERCDAALLFYVCYECLGECNSTFL
ncbi:hypothetical protein HMPREF3190_01108 [Umbribacter vaginalis]|nr:hypothetical protein HMPREF3190_01108 [Coriobacteriales bacterium DNF00809]